MKGKVSKKVARTVRSEFVRADGGHDSDEDESAAGRKALLEQGDLERSSGSESEDDSGNSSDDSESDSDASDASDASSGPAQPRKLRMRGKVLLVCARGASAMERHFIDDLERLLPHARKERKVGLRGAEIAELAELHGCDNVLFVDGKGGLWAIGASGPSVRFQIDGMETAGSLRAPGNCLRGSRAVLSVDPGLRSNPQLRLASDLLIRILGTPRQKSRRPFIDHVMSLSHADGRIWLRHYEMPADLADHSRQPDPSKPPATLLEIGPRITLQITRIFDGVLGGRTLFENATFVPPAFARRAARRAARKPQKEPRDLPQLPKDELAAVFA